MDSRAIEILVMGACGAGKSTFINTLLESEAMNIQHSINTKPAGSLLRVFYSKPGSLGLQSSNELSLVEFPGFDNTAKKDLIALKKIGNWIIEHHTEKSVVGGIIYLYDISEKRIDGTARQNFNMLQKLCGNEAIHAIVLGTTNWPQDEPTPIDNQSREEALQEFWYNFTRKDPRTKRFTGTRDSARELVEMAVEGLANRNIDLKIYRDLLTTDDILQTDAGKHLQVSNGLNLQSGLLEKIRMYFSRLF